MKRIFKYALRTTDIQIVHMPKDAEVLTVQVQNGIPCIWAIVGESDPLVRMEVETFGTGRTMPESPLRNRKYIGTYQLDDGRIVFHVFVRVG